MKHNRKRPLLALIAPAFLLVASATCWADLVFNIRLDTSALIGNPAGPFYIDFQLNDGSGTGAIVNTATISHVLFGTGGNPSGNPQLLGNAKGDLSDSITLMDTQAFNEFFQPFAAGNLLSFNVELSTKVDGSFTPDGFTFSILNQSLTPIPTTNFANALLFVNIDSTNLTVADIANSTFASDLTGAPRVNAIPEPGSSAITLLIGLGIVWCLQRRLVQRLRAQQKPLASREPPRKKRKLVR